MHFFVLLFFILMGLVGYLATLNPGRVTFFLTRDVSIELSITALILFSTALGGFLVIFTAGIHQIKDLYINWQDARREKKEAQVMLYYTDAVNAFVAKRYRDAASLFQKILALNPTHEGSLLRLGKIHRIENNYNDAIRLHRKARGLDDKNVEVLLALAHDLEDAERFEEAMQYLREILQSDERNLAALQRLRDLTIRLQQWEEAYPYQEKLAKLANSGETRKKEEIVLLGIKYEIGRMLLQLGQSGKARRRFKEAIKMDKNFLPAYIGLVGTHLKDGKIELAAALMEKSYELTNHLILLLRLEDFYLEMGEPEKILRLYRKAIDKDPQNTVLRFYLGRLYYRLEMVDDALETLQEIETRIDSFPDLHKVLGNLYQRRGDHSLAIEAFKKALKLQTRVLIPYYCPPCDNHTFEWAGRCNRCGLWNSYQAEPILVEKTDSKALVTSPYDVPQTQQREVM
ncbi:MAG: tetratricopeptide repeat protein [Nitrospiria bacterium]